METLLEAEDKGLATGIRKRLDPTLKYKMQQLMVKYKLQQDEVL